MKQRQACGATGSRARTIAALVATTLALGAPPALAQDEEVGPDISSFTLDNGLEVVVVPDRRAPVVTHMLWYKVGGADDPPGRSGIAHFLEHLMFKGTEANPPGTFSAAVSETGGEENAFTSHDYTGYYQQVPPDALETMMEMEADRMRNLVLTEDVTDTEREVIVEERNQRVENDPQAILEEETSATLYQNHPYGIPVIGWMHEIEALGQDDAVDFYDGHYRPDNAVLVVAGDVDADTVRELAKDTYGELERGPERSPRARPQEPEQDTRRTVTLSDARVGVPNVSVSWVVPSYTTAKDGDAEALDLLSEILGGGANSRLYRELVEDRDMAASTGAWYSGTRLDAGRFAVYGAPRGETDVEELEQAMAAELTRVAEDGIEERELERAKSRLLRDVIFSRDSQSGMARIYGTTLATGGSVEDVDEWPERVRAITAEDIRAAAASLDADDAVASFLLPETDEPT